MGKEIELGIESDEPPSRGTEVNQEASSRGCHDADLSGKHSTADTGWYVLGYRQDISGGFALLRLYDSRVN